MPNRPSEIQCPHYAPAPGSRTCVSFLSGGGCARPDTFMCTEYVRKNPARHVSTPPTITPRPPTAAPAPRDLLGDVVRAEGPKSAPLPSRTSLPIATRMGAPAFTRPITEEQIKALEERGVELCLRTEAAGELWLVPAYTAAGRNEMTFRDAAAIAAMCAVFPGAEVTRFSRGEKGDNK